VEYAGENEEVPENTFEGPLWLGILFVLFTRFYFTTSLQGAPPGVVGSHTGSLLWCFLLKSLLYCFAGAVAQWLSVGLACMKLWVQSPGLQNRSKNKTLADAP
jgi:hypothetical protein